MKNLGRLFFSAPSDIAGGSSASTGGDTAAGSGDADGKSNTTGADNQDVTGATGEQPKDISTGGSGETSKYTESDMQKLRDEFNTRLTEETARAVDEALKKAGMKPEEKTAYEQEQKNKALEEREQQVALRELKADTASLLVQKQLPGEILDIVLGKDKEATAQNIENFKKVFDKAVQAQVEVRLAGATPKSGNVPPPDTDPFLIGFNSK